MYRVPELDVIFQWLKSNAASFLLSQTLVAQPDAMWKGAMQQPVCHSANAPVLKHLQDSAELKLLHIYKAGGIW